MQRIASPWIFAVVVLFSGGLVACLPAPSQRGAAAWAPQPVDTASPDAAAASLAASTGDLYQAEEVGFTFAVERGGQEVVRRRFWWAPTRGVLHVTLPEGTVRFEGLLTEDPSPWVADPAGSASSWARVAPGVDPGVAAAAWAAFINDSFWLIAPAKSLDAGATRELDAAGRLVVSYAGVGVTPGDRYTYAFDPQTGEVRQWTFKLASGREGTFTWEEYATYGRARLSGLRRASDGSASIRLEDVRVVW